MLKNIDLKIGYKTKLNIMLKIILLPALGFPLVSLQLEIGGERTIAQITPKFAFMFCQVVRKSRLA